MHEYDSNEIEALGLQIGCIVRLERLKRKLSQEELGLMIGSNNTTIGRIERYENSTSWENLLKVCQSLEIEFRSLFVLQSLDAILAIIRECITLEEKLTTQKELYYAELQETFRRKLGH